MKIIIKSSIVESAEKSVKTTIETYKEDLPQCDIFNKENINLSLLPSKDIKRKWGTIINEIDKTTIEINDEFIIDLIGLYEKLVCKFAPIINVAVSLIPMVKRYVGDMESIFTSFGKKYEEEKSYTVTKVNFPGIETGYVLMSRIRDEEWTFCESRMNIQMESIDKDFRENLIKNVGLHIVKEFNANTPAEFPIYSDFAEAYDAMTSSLFEGRYGNGEVKYEII